ncbi:MAG: lipoate--protein ligase family protein [Nitrospirales bacterium]|nr:lipoate--protein ligase family protein [Nitrospirales bacterium]
METWRFIVSGPCPASYNMALDEAISLSVREGSAPTTLRLYGWDCPSVSIGQFQKIETINSAYCEAHQIPVVRRPTGGRGILHGDELTYSLSGRNEGPFSRGLMETYLIIGTALKMAMELTGIPVSMKMERESGRNLTRSPLCFRSSSFGEIGIKGKKLVGSAQKRWREGFLQQGSIPYCLDYNSLSEVFTGDEDIVSPPGSEMIGLREVCADFSPELYREAIRTAFQETFGIRLLESQPSHQEEESARRLCSERYLPLRLSPALRPPDSNEEQKR